MTAERRVPDGRPLVVCDLTQSWSTSGGGGISTYLREKRDHFLHRTQHRLVQIVPGREDRVTVNGRHVLAEVGADPVRGSPDYRFILRTSAVRRLLAEYRPDVIESLCPWVLPWTAIGHRRRFPQAALVAGYRTDFPEAHVYRVAVDRFGERAGRVFRWLSYGYAEVTYRAFDRVYALGESARTALEARLGSDTVDVLPLGVDVSRFAPAARDPAIRIELGLPAEGPLIAYAGRIDNEKRAATLVDMFRRLPPSLGASMVMIGEGKRRAELMAATTDLPIAWPGFEPDRARLARLLASADLYASAMPDETFGISVLEAQAAGLAVVGVASGAMPDRVPAGLGLLGPVDDADAMAANVAALLADGGEPARIAGRAARTHAEGFAWIATFDRLLNQIYPAALARAAGRVPAPLAAVTRVPGLVPVD